LDEGDTKVSAISSSDCRTKALNGGYKGWMYNGKGQCRMYTDQRTNPNFDSTLITGGPQQTGCTIQKSDVKYPSCFATPAPPFVTGRATSLPTTATVEGTSYTGCYNYAKFKGYDAISYDTGTKKCFALKPATELDPTQLTYKTACTDQSKTYPNCV
jgi:hypothetical protein